MLALACAATLCGARSYGAMAEALEVDPGLLASLGLGRHGPPSAATLHRVFRWLDVGALERALGGWAQAVLAAQPGGGAGGGGDGRQDPARHAGGRGAGAAPGTPWVVRR